MTKPMAFTGIWRADCVTVLLAGENATLSPHPPHPSLQFLRDFVKGVVVSKVIHDYRIPEQSTMGIWHENTC